MNLNPYLTFDGRAAEAIAFYSGVFATEPMAVMTYSDMPSTEGLPPGMEGMIAHARMQVGGVLLQISDGFGAHEGWTGFSLQLDCTSVAEARALFEALSEGGEIVMPLQEEFWADAFGLCRDRFGVPWMVNCEKTA